VTASAGRPTGPPAVALARPVNWSDVGMSPDVVAAIVERVRAEHPTDVSPEHDPVTGVYPGSVVRDCAACGVRCWVGPRTLGAVDAGIALVGCYRCVIEAQGAGALDLVWSLGNTDVARRADGR
jgi:hypothetical protein